MKMLFTQEDLRQDLTDKESKAIQSLYIKLHKAKDNFPTIEKDGKNSFFQIEVTKGKKEASRYITLEALCNLLAPILKVHSLYISQPIQLNSLATIITDNESGISIVLGVTELPTLESLSSRTNGIQQLGSAITYMRRYSLLSGLGLVADADDDGNSQTKTIEPITIEPIRPKVSSKGFEPLIKVPTYQEYKAKYNEVSQAKPQFFSDYDDNRKVVLKKMADSEIDFNTFNTGSKLHAWGYLNV